MMSKKTIHTQFRKRNTRQLSGHERSIVTGKGRRVYKIKAKGDGVNGVMFGTKLSQFHPTHKGRRLTAHPLIDTWQEFNNWCTGISARGETLDDYPITCDQFWETFKKRGWRGFMRFYPLSDNDVMRLWDFMTGYEYLTPSGGR